MTKIIATITLLAALFLACAPGASAQEKKNLVVTYKIITDSKSGLIISFNPDILSGQPVGVTQKLGNDISAVITNGVYEMHAKNMLLFGIHRGANPQTLAEQAIVAVKRCFPEYIFKQR